VGGINYDRIMNRVEPEPTSGCWLWTACLDKDGYGRTGVYVNGKKRMYYTHRFMYEWHVGAIPDGMVCDHKCKVRSCCNPDHIDIVTPAENQRRGDSGKASHQRALARSSCLKGHEYAEFGVYRHTDGRRRCAECARLAAKRYQARKAAA
jgi:hypothetical protein